MSRTARIERATSESSVVVEINLDGTGQTDISTTVPFYDHMSPVARTVRSMSEWRPSAVSMWS